MSRGLDEDVADVVCVTLGSAKKVHMVGKFQYTFQRSCNYLVKMIRNCEEPDVCHRSKLDVSEQIACAARVILKKII